MILRKRTRVLLLLVIVLLSGCGKKESAPEQQTESLRPVRTMVVSAENTSSKYFAGVVEAQRTAELGFRVSGELTAVEIKEGSDVKQGETLAQLDQTDFRIQLDASQGAYSQAKSDYDRAESLVKKGAISKSDFDKLKAQFISARAQRDAAKKNLEYTVLKAPFDGVIARLNFSNFEKITSSSVFAVIHDLSAFTVKIDVPESVMIKVRRGEEIEVFATFDDGEESQYPLTFKEVSTTADEKNQTYQVTFSMDAPQGLNLLPGMSAKVGTREQAAQGSGAPVYIPAHAVLEDDQGRFAYIVTESGENRGVVSRVAVVVGDLNENGIQILQGLSSGDLVVTAGMSKMQEGLAVRLMSGVK